VLWWQGGLESEDDTAGLMGDLGCSEPLEDLGLRADEELLGLDTGGGGVDAPVSNAETLYQKQQTEVLQVRSRHMQQTFMNDHRPLSMYKSVAHRLGDHALQHLSAAIRRVAELTAKARQADGSRRTVSHLF
jgi:hypothetical protein